MMGGLIMIPTSWVTNKSHIKNSRINAQQRGIIAEIIEKLQKLEKNEEILKMASESARLGFWDYDSFNNIVTIDEMWAAIGGYTIEELAPITIETWKGLVHPDDLKKSDEMWEKHFSGEIEYYECPVRMKHKDGSWVWVLDRGKVVERDENNAPIRTVGIHIDITERKKVQDEIQEAQIAAESANLAKSRFVANISHELRTPINGFMGFLDLLGDTKLDDEQIMLLGEAKAASENLLHLINQVLDFSKIEAGKLIIENINFKIREVVKECANLFMAKAIQKNIKIVTIVKANVPDNVMGDPSRIKQVLNNLINNALKFTEGGKITIVAETIKQTGKKVYIRFDVKDTGIGIDKENIKKLFNPFIQADSSTTRQYGGTGLGLSISKQIVNIMGGKINIKSKVGAGSDFYFTIKLNLESFSKPACNDEIMNYTLDTLKLQKEDKFKEKLSSNYNLDVECKETLKPSILLVEDNEMNRKIILMSLKNNGLLCDTAVNGYEAVKAVKDKKYDIIFMDCQMPVMDGYESTREIRQIDKIGNNIVIIAMTANALEGDKEECLKAGMDDYISKPIDFELMFNMIKSYSTKLNNNDTEDSFLKSYMQNFSIDSGLSMNDTKEIFEAYINSMPEIFSKFDEALNKNDFKELAETAHKLKGSSGNLRIKVIFELASSIDISKKVML
jgi:two-component system sensor histidine kinase/response regulator